ncbi:acyltransferase family protein [Collinsella sp. SGI.184]|uniref:acyltransferase family protein n=1 Tax=Collinsella sp. SGI.184 TaxID=3420556 RepID=UPI003CFEFE12
MSKERNSLIELFRLISMWCVVAHHFVIHNADAVSVFPNPVARFTLNEVFIPIGKVAVGCFVFITVWFMASRTSFGIKDAIKKIMLLHKEVVFYSIVLGAISVFTGNQQFSLFLVIKTLFPIATGYGWWFINSYAALILLLPYLMVGLRACNKKGHRFLAQSLTFVYGLFRYLPFVTFPAGGLLIDFIVLAVDICYFRWYIDLDITKWKSLALIGVASFVLGIACNHLPYYSHGIIKEFAVNLFDGYVYSPASILSMGLSFTLSLSVFKLSKVYHIKSTVINWVAASALAVYLISEFQFVQDFLWKSIFTFGNLGNQHGILLVITIPSFVMICCLAIDIARRLITSQISNYINRSAHH